MEQPHDLDADAVLVAARDGALEITLNRPRVRNAMNRDVRARLWSELTQAARDDAVRVVVLRGSGSAFCSGADVSDLAAEPTTTLGTLDMGRDIVTAVASMPKPVVAAVRGAAVGAGMSLALACDLVVADLTAVFHPIFVRRGLAPDWGCTHWLVRHLGLARAKDILLTGRSVAADEAHALGLIARLWPEDVFEARLADLVSELATGPTLAMGVTKRMLNRAAETDLAGMLALETYGQVFATSTADHAEAVRAFSERRQAAFRAR